MMVCKLSSSDFYFIKSSSSWIINKKVFVFLLNLPHTANLRNYLKGSEAFNYFSLPSSFLQKMLRA